MPNNWNESKTFMAKAARIVTAFITRRMVVNKF